MPRRYDTYPDYRQRDVSPTDDREAPTTSDEEIADVDPNAAGTALAAAHGGANEGKWTSYVRTSAWGKKYRVYTQRTLDGGVVTVDAERGADYTPGSKTAADTSKTPSIRTDTSSRTEQGVDPETGKVIWTRDKTDPISQGMEPFKVDEKGGRALFWVPPDKPGDPWTQAWSPYGEKPKQNPLGKVEFAPNTDIPIGAYDEMGNYRDFDAGTQKSVYATLQAQNLLPSQQKKAGATDVTNPSIPIPGWGTSTTGSGGSGTGSGKRTEAQDALDWMNVEKARRALLPEQELIIQNHYDTVDWIQGQIAAGLMTPQEGDAYLEQSKKYMQAALEGTTPYQQNQLKENLKRQDQKQGFDMVQTRVQQQNSLAQGLLSALANSKVMTPKGGGSLNLDVLGIARNAMAQDYGPNYSAIAQQLLAGGNVPMGQQQQATPVDVASMGTSNPYNSSNPFERLGLLAGGRNGIVPNS